MFNTILSRKVNRQKLFKAKLRYKSNQKKIGTSFESIKKRINYTNSMKKVFGIFAIALCGGLVALGINGVVNKLSDSGSF